MESPLKLMEAAVKVKRAVGFAGGVLDESAEGCRKMAVRTGEKTHGWWNLPSVAGYKRP
jgi:hypothetical protein